MENIFYYDLPLTSIGIIANEQAITHIFFNQNQYQNYAATLKETPLIKEAAKQLDEYFAKKRTDFDLPLDPKGTDFQKKVWQALRTIPYGTTCCYRDVAVMIGHPLAARAIGQANNRNPICIVNP